MPTGTHACKLDYNPPIVVMDPTMHAAQSQNN